VSQSGGNKKKEEFKDRLTFDSQKALLKEFAKEPVRQQEEIKAI